MNTLARLSHAAVALTSLGALTSFSTQADTLLGVYAGGQMWAMETEGAFASNNDLSSFRFDDERNASLYVAFEHFVPLILNAKIISTSMDTDGTAVLANQFSFGGESFAVDANLSTDLALSTIDYILYYEILDNDLFSFDIGVNAKKIDGDITVVDQDTGSVSDMSFSGYIPMAYSRAELGLPFTNWSIFAEGSYLSLNDHTVSDLQAALEYRLIDSLAVNLTMQIGYRAMNIELDDLDGVYSELEFSGAYAGIEFHF